MPLPTVLVIEPILLCRIRRFSNVTVVVTIVSTHITTSTWRDGQAELVWVAWLNTKSVYPRTITISVKPGYTYKLSNDTDAC